MAAVIVDLAVERIIRAVKNGDFALAAKIGKAARNIAKPENTRQRPAPTAERAGPTPGTITPAAARPRRRHPEV